MVGSARADVVEASVGADETRGPDRAARISDIAAGEIDDGAWLLNEICAAERERAADRQHLLDGFRNEVGVAGRVDDRRADPGHAVGPRAGPARVDRHRRADERGGERRIGDLIGRDDEGHEKVGDRNLHIGEAGEVDRRARFEQRRCCR